MIKYNQVIKNLWFYFDNIYILYLLLRLLEINLCQQIIKYANVN